MFVGRTQELQKLTALLGKESASLVVVRGRRRIGKSTLIQAFGRHFPIFLQFSGLPPTSQTTAAHQREEFVLQLNRQVHLPGLKHDDWGELFWHLAMQTKKGRTLILLDEITWMGSKDPIFLGKLKNAWDQHFKQNPKLILVLCGSISAWIDQNILSHTGFLGRVSLDLSLSELKLSDCNQFWGKRKDRIAAHEKLKVLAVTGGVPRYLEEINPALSAEENIRRLCFQPEGILLREFDQIFSDLFDRRAPLYQQIVSHLAKGSQSREALLRERGVKKGGVLTRYLEDLQKAGFISRDYTWRLSQAKPSKLSLYRLSDNYLRFYLKYIRPNLAKIKANRFAPVSLYQLPGWEAIMGLQFENLVLHNRRPIFQKLHLADSDVLSDNPFFQTQTRGQAACQIDYLIHAKYNTLYLCEIKFSREPIRKQVISEVEEKRRRLKTPKQFTVRPVLIYAGTCHPEIEESDYFDQCINFSTFLG